RTERSGAVAKIQVSRGERVKRDQVLVELDATDARTELATAEARITTARAELDVLSKGGRAADLAEIAGQLSRAKLDLQNAQREYDSLVRLQEKQAAPRVEVEAAHKTVEQ